MKKRVFIILLALFAVLSLSALTCRDVQYSEASNGDSPLDGDVVTLEEVLVVATGYDGDKFFVSDPDGGEWSGLYVFDYTVSVEVGDLISITGVVDEYYNFTELKNISSYEIISTGNELPTPIIVTTQEVQQEKYESCLIAVENVEVTSTTNTHGEFEVSDGSGDLIINDTFDDFDPADVPTSIDDSYAVMTGIIEYNFNQFRLNPRTLTDVIFDDESAPVPTEVESINSTTLHVIFNDALNEDSATNIANYSISPSIQITDAVLVNHFTIALTVNGLEERSYEMTIQNISDAYDYQMTDSVVLSFIGIKSYYGETMFKIERRVFAPSLGQVIEMKINAQTATQNILRFYNAEGKLVHTLYPENRIVEWDGKDRSHNLLPIGLYIVHLESIRQSDGHKSTAQLPIVIGKAL